MTTMSTTRRLRRLWATWWSDPGHSTSRHFDQQQPHDDDDDDDDHDHGDDHDTYYDIIIDNGAFQLKVIILP